jgi:mono/diheme cytochrome c family protein
MKPMIKHTLILASLAVLAAGPALAQSSGGSYSGSGGQAVFEQICAACHQPGGVGYPGAYPALAKNPKLAVAGYPIAVVLNGQNHMPALGGMLDDQQISDVVNYVRTNLGNAYKPTTTPADVKAVRR